MQILRVSGADLEASLKVALYDLLQSVNLDVCLVLICIMCMPHHLPQTSFMISYTQCLLCLLIVIA